MFSSTAQGWSSAAPYASSGSSTASFSTRRPRCSYTSSSVCFFPPFRLNRLLTPAPHAAVEKVHVVWGGRQSRLRSKVYLGCVFVLFVYVGVAIFLFFGACLVDYRCVPIRSCCVLWCRSYLLLPQRRLVRHWSYPGCFAHPAHLRPVRAFSRAHMSVMRLTPYLLHRCVNILLTSLFVWPLLDNQFTPSIRKVAVRTLW